MRSMLQSLPLPVFAMFVFFPLLMAGVAAFAGLHARRRAAIVKATPTSPIGMAEDGYREFEGVVEAIGGQTLTSPLTQSPCCWYHAKVEKWVPSRSSSPASWTTVREATSDAPFFVRDGTGVCTVRPHGAEVTPKDRSIWKGGTEVPEDRNPKRVPPTESAEGMVRITGPGSNYRYTEERLYPGDPLLVLGDFTSGRFASSAVDDDDEDEDDDLQDNEGDDLEANADGDAGDEPDEDAAAHPADDPFDDSVIADQLTERAWEITKASIGKGASRQPFMFTATPQAQHLEMTSKGGSAAIGIAVVPLAIALFFIWLRYS
jgi:hypothetical protein